jgi:quercetin dioxygenase-like cupin family protein
MLPEARLSPTEIAAALASSSSRYADQSQEDTMRQSSAATGVVIAGGIVAAMLGGPGPFAAEKREVYVSPGADKKALINEPLHGAEAKTLTVDHYTFPPGWIGGKHYHTGPVYVYVLEGSFTIDEQGKERRTFKPGELYKEPIGVPMQARNPNASEPLKVLVVQVTTKGEPQMVKAD